MAAQIVWFRNDLRVHDHAPLKAASGRSAAESSPLLCVYFDDPRFQGTTSFGFPRTGRHRRRFLAESISDLERNLQRLGNRLIVVVGKPEQGLPLLARHLDASHVFYHEELATEEVGIAQRVFDGLKRMNVRAVASPPNTLLELRSLPFAIPQTPEVFSKFRRKVEHRGIEGSALQSPSTLPPSCDSLPDEVETSYSDDMFPEDVNGFGPEGGSRVGGNDFRGGESAGLQRIDRYFWDQDLLRVYKQTRNGMLGMDYSSKLSPWLAHGCLSARRIHEEILRYEDERISNDSTYWLKFELLWRDYFALMVAKHGSKVFRVEGLRGLKLEWSDDWWAFDWWRSGQTGYTLVDANMRELEATGFMSNRGRQNVASFLTKNLGIDWRMGAEWFESLLIDYDPCSNYGNWNYGAGVGNDARFFRWFNILKQSKDYDPDGEYVRYWLPELQSVPNEFVHSPWMMDDSQQTASGCRIGVDYPNPIVDLAESAEAGRRIYESAIGAP